MAKQVHQSVGLGSALAAVAPVSLGLSVVGADGLIRSANQTFATRSGYAADEMKGRPLTSCIHADTDNACIRTIDEALAKGREYAGPVHWRRRNAVLKAELAIIPVTERGALVHFLVVLRQRDEVDETEVQLDATSERMQRLLDNLPAGVVVHGSDSRILAVNARAGELLGSTPEALLGKDVHSGWRFLNDDGDPMSPEEYPVSRTLAERRNLFGLVVGIVSEDQADPSWVLCNTYLVCDGGGHVSEAVVCFTDCTRLKRTERSLHKSEERLRLVLQGSSDASWDWNLCTGEVYYSPRWWEMIGRQPGELEEDPELWVRMAAPDEVARVRQVFEQALGGKAHSYEIEFKLRHKDGHYLPVLARGIIMRDARGRPLRVSGTKTDLTERKLAEQSIHQLAYFDHLTELPNRRMLMDDLRRLISRNARRGEWAALLYIDLDNFKLLNDTLGHDIGDQLLRQVGSRLRHTVRDADCVARLGGDEFVILLDGLGKERHSAAAEAGQVAHKVMATCAEVYTLPSRPYRSTPSIGIALFDGGTQADVVLRQADLAMYQAKAAGRNTMRFFDPAMQAAIDRRCALEHDLREGLERDQFRLFCQPQFDREGRLAGGEVLLRWQRSDTELVSPAEFIGLAEATGFVMTLGQWVLDETCKHLAEWRHHPRLSRVPLAVNVSAQQLRCADFTRKVLDAVRVAGADPRQLGLELTESLLAENLEDVIAKMECLKRDGVHFSIDDFGTGYSSLSYLKRFPLETLKIDRSFVHDIHLDPATGAIVEVIITLARKLGLKVIAEGVEQEAQRQFLRDGGCDWFQGYLLGRPLAIDEFAHTFGNA
jgi:diguanylate cyclase (GGDEF)-like protein/PAS domain S-box-containing protein